MSKSSGGGRLILLVEDHASVLDVLTRVLERAGFQVMPAISLAAAIDLWEDFAPFLSLIITDLCSMDPGGHPLLERLAVHHIRADVPVLIVSSPLHATLAQTAPPGFIVDFLAKPFDHVALLGRIQALMQPA